MIYYVARRIIQGFVLLLVAMVITFLVFQVLGDPVRRALPLNASAEQIEVFRQANGYADPLYERMARFLRGVVVGDFGTSSTFGTSALGVAAAAVPRTLALAVCAFALSLVAGCAIGTLAAVNRDGWADKVVTAASVFVASLAEFWVGLALIVVLAVQLGLFPTGGYGLDWRLVLPSLALAIPSSGRIAFYVRGCVRTVLDEQHVAFARSLGLSPRTLLQRHIIRNSLTPVLAYGGVEFTRMAVGGAIVVETVFGWPGLGRLYVQAMQRYDVALVSATLFIATIIVIVLNIALDLTYSRIDPRVRLSH